MEDICASKNGGNQQSREAHKKASRHAETDRVVILNMISEWSEGLSMKEVAALMGRGLHMVSPRGSELKKAGLVEPTGIVRDGSMVLRVTRTVQASVEAVTRQQVPVVPEPAKPLSPAQVRKEMDELDHLYESTSLLTSEAYDAAKNRLISSFEAWFNG